MQEDVPRYENPYFTEENPAKPPLGYCGGKLIDGVVHYPQGVEVNRVKAARIQAFVDYSLRAGGTATPNSEMAALYGEAYVHRFQALERKPACIAERARLHHQGQSGEEEFKIRHV